MQTPTECYLTGEAGVTLLRFEGPRERLALPYATLLGLSLSTDETVLEFDFASHRISIKGKRLHEVFCAVAAGRGQALFVQSETEEFTRSRASTAPSINGMRIVAAATGS